MSINLGMKDDVLFAVEDHLGLITLNRPKALNALTMTMFEAIDQQLRAWQHDEHVHAVVVQAPPGKIFCAGGDVRWVFDVGRDDPLVPMRLFNQEYRLNHLISTFGKPYIALMDGLTIGGGVGITLHGSHPVGGTSFAFMMPEASIGFFPDIGASHLLSACPRGFGLYLGLTGRRLKAADAYAMGLIKYTVSSDKLPEILMQLKQADLSVNATQRVDACLETYHETVLSDLTATDVDAIAGAFDQKTCLAEVFDALEHQQTSWADETKALLLEQSPLSLHVTFEQLKRAKHLNLAECLSMDYMLAYHFFNDHDFYEGVRARLVDKDKSPKWSPASWEDVSVHTVVQYFDPSDALPPLW